MGIRHKLYAFRYVAVSCCRRPLMTNRDDSRSLTVKIGSRGCNNLPFGSGADRDEVSQKDYVKSTRTIQAWQDCRSTGTQLSSTKILLSIPPCKQELARFVESASASHLPVRATSSPYAKSIAGLLGQLDRWKIAPRLSSSGSESCGKPSSRGRDYALLGADVLASRDCCCTVWLHRYCGCRGEYCETAVFHFSVVVCDYVRHPPNPRAPLWNLKFWWRRLDSNQRPTDYETVALAT